MNIKFIKEQLNINNFGFLAVKICLLIFSVIMCNHLCSTLLDTGQQFRKAEEESVSIKFNRLA